MSDAEKQSVERCKPDEHEFYKVDDKTVCRKCLIEKCRYRHDWYKVPATETTNEYYVCRKCDCSPRTDKQHKQAEAYVFLRSVLPKGSTVYTILKHVSRSGMTRGIECYALTVEPEKIGDAMSQVGRPLWITSYVGHAIDSPQPIDYWRKSLGLKVNGCGMDMGFHVVNSLSYALYDDGYAIKHAWL